MLPRVALEGRRTRARNRDRDRAIDALSLAYSDGQIGPEEHEARVARALAAVQLAELRPLIDDVQLPDSHPAAALLAAPPSPPTRTPAPTTHGPGRSRVAWSVVAVGALLVGGAMVAGVGDSASESLDVRPRTAAGLSLLIEDYEEEFGTTEAVQVELFEEYAAVLVPADGGDGRFVRYYYDDDGFSEQEGGSAADAVDLVDLAAVDVDALVGNIDVARDTLEVEEPEIQRVVIADDYDPSLYQALGDLDFESDVPAHVLIVVSNQFSEMGSLATDLGGDSILLDRPFEPVN